MVRTVFFGMLTVVSIALAANADADFASVHAAGRGGDTGQGASWSRAWSGLDDGARRVARAVSALVDGEPAAARPSPARPAAPAAPARPDGAQSRVADRPAALPVIAEASGLQFERGSPRT